MKKTDTKVKSFRLSIAEAQELDRFADQHGLLVSDVCRTAVVGYLAAVGKIISSDKSELSHLSDNSHLR